MNFSAPFIARPVATTLLTLGIVLAGLLAFTQLPVSPMPQFDFPTISVQASLPGASPETMATTVATPLERSLGVIAGVTELTSSSSLGSTRITLQFDLSRDIDGAARDVQAALNAARSLLPTGMPSNPTYRKVNPAEAPVMVMTLTSATMSRGEIYDAASTILAQKIAQVDGVGQVTVGGASLPAVRVELAPGALNKYGIGTEDVRAAIVATNANRPKGIVEEGERNWQILANDQAMKGRRISADHRRLSQRRGGAPRRRRARRGRGAGSAQRRSGQRQAGGDVDPQPSAGRQHHRHRRPHQGAAAAVARLDFPAPSISRSPWSARRRSAPRCAKSNGRWCCRRRWWCWRYSSSCATVAPR